MDWHQSLHTRTNRRGNHSAWTWPLARSVCAAISSALWPVCQTIDCPHTVAMDMYDLEDDGIESFRMQSLLSLRLETYLDYHTGMFWASLVEPCAS